MIAALLQLFGCGGAADAEAERRAAMERAFFTIDDGQTVFVDRRQPAPFLHGGKPAYQAFVFTHDGGATRDVAYLMRCTPEALERLTKAQTEGGPPPMGVSPSDYEVKRPGQPAWTRMIDPRAADIMKPALSPESSDLPTIVMP